MSQAASRVSNTSKRGSQSTMAASQGRRQGPRSRNYIDGLIAVLVIAAAAACVSFYLRTRAELEAAQTKRAAQAHKIEKLQAETERVANEIDRLKNDPRFIESIARQSLGMVRPGDVVIRLDDLIGQSPNEPKAARLTPRKGSDYTDDSH